MVLKENRRLPEGERQRDLPVVYDAAREIRAPIVKATVIISIVFVPLFFLSGVEGRMLQPRLCLCRQHSRVARGGGYRHAGPLFVPASPSRFPRP